MKIPPEAPPLVQASEGCRLTPYRDAVGVPTIGWGHTPADMHGGPITQARADRLLDADLTRAMLGALRYCPALITEPSRRLAAITDFCFNLGSGRLKASTLRRRINARDWPGAQRELARWVRAGAFVLPGLVIRRSREARLLR